MPLGAHNKVTVLPTTAYIKPTLAAATYRAVTPKKRAEKVSTGFISIWISPCLSTSGFTRQVAPSIGYETVAGASRHAAKPALPPHLYIKPMKGIVKRCISRVHTNWHAIYMPIREERSSLPHQVALPV